MKYYRYENQVSSKEVIQIIEFDEWKRLGYSDQIAKKLQEESNYGDDMALITAQQASNALRFAMACFGNTPNKDTIFESVSKINKFRKDAGLLESINPFGLEDMSELFRELSTIDDIKPTIPELKKRIKYCRNPMEKKKLQQELNQAYKEQKKRR